MSHPLSTLTPNVPIIGNPYELKAVIPTVLAVCGCEAKTLVVLLGLGGTAQCQACKRIFMLAACEANPQTQGARISVSNPPPES